MISFLVVWFTGFFKNLVQLHEEIGGQWRNYLVNLYQLKRYTRANPKGRVDLHDVWCNETEHGGLLPFDEETEYANPKVDKSEDLFIFGSNSEEKTTIQVYFKRRPLPRTGKFAVPKDQVEVKFRLYDGQTGNTYWMEEKSTVEFSATEYRASGFAFESLQANKTSRIKFRGYLHRNDEAKLVYVQIRFLCLSFSKTYDHQRNIDESFLAKELLTEGVGSVVELLEDKIDQNIQIKGTFKIENEDEVQFFYLGHIGRRFLPTSQQQTRKVVKINGHTTRGIGFQLGVVKEGRKRYRYGYMTKGFDNWKVLREISLSKDELENVTNAKSIVFEAKFVDDEAAHKFEVTSGKDGLRLVKINGDDGVVFITEQEFNETEKAVARKNDSTEKKELDNALVVALDEDCARVTELTGGKGASLAQLKKLSSDEGTEWQVPNAVVVTSSAYRVQTEAMSGFEERLEKLERQVISREEVEANCEKFVQWFASNELHEKVKGELKRKLASEFGAEWESMLFAVRSSAANEDSSEMSAAGQMTTYLGLSGLERVSRAVVACWASQFAFVPAEYKRGYGQALSAPMAVVVQRMVDCSSAGVIFTANPTDGDERVLTVTSNFGLGESVVSAAAEPDTFTLAVDIEANSYQTKRRISSIAGKQLGKKALVTRLNTAADQEDIEAGIQNEQIADGATRQSLSDEDLIRLGNIALDIAAHYGNPRDIEWGFVDGQLFMFQSRPITNLDSNFSSYELMHEQDTPHCEEKSLYSRNHWGENFPGSSSWLCGLFFLGGTQFSQGAVKQGQMKAKDFNFLRPTMGYVCNQLMFNLRGGSFFMSMFKDYPKSDAAVANVFAFFGRHITNPDFLEAIRDNSEKIEKSTPLLMKLLMPFIMAYMLFFGCRAIPKIEKKIFVDKEIDFKTPTSKVPLKDKLRTMFDEMSKAFHVMQVHGAASFGSSLKSQFLMKLLKSSGDSEHVMSDLNLLMSHCNDVVSAEVPNMLRDIAKAIQAKEEFAALSDEEALDLLKSKTKEPKASELFAQFLEKHSHRGYREFDPLHLPWGKNPIPCVQVVKSMMRGASLEAKREKPVDEILEELKTPISWTKKQLIKYWFLPWVRDAVGYREHTKSIMVKFNDLMREVMWHMAEEMVKAGYLPEADLFFFLRTNEIQRLADGERNPMLVMKAKQRKRLYPTMNALKFDEFVTGLRMAPRPPKKEMIQLAEDSVCMKGTPVTVGSIKARVCVAETIEEAVHIRPGDILLTYSTDIGWSPYFPLLSGIVTEIGGTVSHGAVIAREFGIPCLIAVEDVCQYFRTGDIAYLDTKTGTIVKVKE